MTSLGVQFRDPCDDKTCPSLRSMPVMNGMRGSRSGRRHEVIGVGDGSRSLSPVTGGLRPVGDLLPPHAKAHHRADAAGGHPIRDPRDLPG
jgi:hypothetical protein